MYSPIFQGTSSDTSGLQCIIALVMLAVAWIVLANLASKTKNVMPYSRTVTTSLSRDEATKLVDSSFSKTGLTVASNWQRSWPTPDKFALSGYYLTDGQGCLAMLLTGIIPGYLLIKYVMGRTEQVTVDFSKFLGTGELTLEAKGLRAQREVSNLITKLGVKKDAPSEAALETRRDQVAAGLCPKCGNAVSPTDQNCPSCKVNLTFAREHLDQL
jgi:hypothetical protein